jgi:hypothetical protein
MTREEIVRKQKLALEKLKRIKECIHMLGVNPLTCATCRADYDYLGTLLKAWEKRVAPPSKIALASDRMAVLEDYITHYGYIVLRTIPETEEWTKEKFLDVTGYELDDGMSGYKKEDYQREDGSGRQWSYSTAGRVEFNAEVGLFLRNEGFPVSKSDAIHDTGYVWNLLSRGFILGNQNQQAEKEQEHGTDQN